MNALQRFGRSRASNQSVSMYVACLVCLLIYSGLFSCQQHFKMDFTKNWPCIQIAKPDGLQLWVLWHRAYLSTSSFNTFPWSRKTLVWLSMSVGGTGTVSVGLASCFPNIDFVVQDTPSTIASLDKSAGLQGRVRFQDYDMFTPQPVEYADIYFFRNIFHNWSDEDCIKILRNHAPCNATMVQNLWSTIFRYMRPLSPASVGRKKDTVCTSRCLVLQYETFAQSLTNHCY